METNITKCDYSCNHNGRAYMLTSILMDWIQDCLTAEVTHYTCLIGWKHSGRFANTLLLSVKKTTAILLISCDFLKINSTADLIRSCVHIWQFHADSAFRLTFWFHNLAQYVRQQGRHEAKKCLWEPASGSVDRDWPQRAARCGIGHYSVLSVYY